MKLQNKSYIILFIFFFISCKSKQYVTEYKDRIVKDTIVQTKIIKEVERFTDTLTIEKPCDSLGNLKPFKQIVKVPQGDITLTGINNNISAQIDLKGYKDQLEKTYQSKYEKFTENYNKEVIRYKIPFWCWIYIVCSTAIIILLLKIR
tara:strand:+ start:25875 stop:26318 length:444 start_codon:yes stop_codon:yes gene_type:complete